MAEGQFTSQERVYVDRDGNRVDAKDPKRHKLVVAEGGSLSMDEARRLGLVREGEAGEVSPAGVKADDNAEVGGVEEPEGEAIDAAEESLRVQGKASKKPAKKASKK